jgi:hypothetical protein
MIAGHNDLLDEITWHAKFDMLAFNYEFEYFTIFLKQPEKNNNEQKTVTDFKNESNGIIVSRVVNGSPAPI